MSRITVSRLALVVSGREIAVRILQVQHMVPDLLLLCPRDFGRSYVHTAVRLESVAVHDLSLKPKGEENCQPAFSRCRGSENHDPGIFV